MGDHDWYCYDCHRPGSVLECSECWRVFHLTCTDDDTEMESEGGSFVCAVCKVKRLICCRNEGRGSMKITSKGCDQEIVTICWRGHV